MAEALLEVRDLKKYFSTPAGLLRAVDGVSFSIEKGRTLGVVGESGCGKSTTGRAILRLVEPTSGQVLFDGTDVTALNRSELRAMRRQMQIVFQDPYSSLDPRKALHKLISEPMEMAGLVTDKRRLEQRVLELMDTVGLARRLYYAYPHELDGGRRQRIGIARALAVNPRFIVCDEPVSALDVSIQAQILNLLGELKQSLGLTYLFITHDLSVIYCFADDVAVMYLGRVVERAPADQLFAHPRHPYTRALLSAIPSTDIDRLPQRELLPGEVTSPIDLPVACRFAPRCRYATGRCRAGEPELTRVEPEHWVACWLLPD